MLGNRSWYCSGGGTRIQLVAGVLLLALALFYRPAYGAPGDDDFEIAAVIESAYVQGVWIQRDPDLVRAGFAPTFVMQVYWEGELSSRTLDGWLERMSLDRVPTGRSVRSEVSVLAVTGDAAVARVELYLDGEHAYTDFFGLYRRDGWKIVTKHFQAHR